MAISQDIKQILAHKTYVVVKIGNYSPEDIIKK